MSSANRRLWLAFAASVLVPFGTLAIGFRLYYDNVIPEVAGLVLTAAILAYLRPRYAWLWVIGIAIGILISERLFPATPPPAHVARYGPPVRGGFTDLLKLCAIPATAAVVGAASRLFLDWFAAPAPHRIAR